MTHKSISDWHRVYRKNYKKTQYTDDWAKAKVACLKRDKNTCQRCDKKGNNYERHVTAHHIIPRAEEGANDLSNLITLCDPCHDFVEIHDLRTWAEIIGSYEDEVNRSLEASENERTEDRTDEGYHFIRPDWHKYVYGGQRRRK